MQSNRVKQNPSALIPSGIKAPEYTHLIGSDMVTELHGNRVSPRTTTLELIRQICPKGFKVAIL